MSDNKNKKTVHGDITEHNFSPVGMIDRGAEVHKVYECGCGIRMTEVYMYYREVYENR